MKKTIIIIGLISISFFLITMIWVWNSGKLFVRIPSAKINLNGVDSDKSSLYKSKLGNFFVFLEKDKAEHPVYVVLPTDKVGIPTDIVPSMGTLSFKTEYFLVCLDFEIEVAGTDFFASDAKSSISHEEINFQVNKDNVNVKF